MLCSTDDLPGLLFARRTSAKCVARRRGFTLQRGRRTMRLNDFVHQHALRVTDVVSSGTVVMLKASGSLLRANPFRVMRRSAAECYGRDHRRNVDGWSASSAFEDGRDTRPCCVTLTSCKTGIISVGRIPRGRKDIDASARMRSVFPGNHAVVTKWCCNMSLDTPRLGR